MLRTDQITASRTRPRHTHFRQKGRPSQALSRTMAASQHSESFLEEVTCPVCLECFTDPVCLQCGHNFCRACITRCWQRPGAPPLCPQCRAVCTGRALHPNVGLRNIAEAIRMSLPEATALCPRHQQRLQLFCETDLEPICVVCDRSREHRWHDVMPAEEAAQEYKGTLNGRIKQLNEELEDLQKWKAESSRTASDLERNFKLQTGKIMNVFELLKQFLEKEKKQLLTRLEKEHAVYMKVIQEKVLELEKQQTDYRILLTELEGLCQKQDVEILKAVPNILNRCDNVKTLKLEEDLKLLPTVRIIEHLYTQEKLIELTKTFPAELATLIAGIQKKDFESEKHMVAAVHHSNAFYENRDG